jgi:dGTPase
VPYDEWTLERHRITSPEDYRDAFARDRDRILYSSAFRRLAGKTQVVAAGEAGLYHNRLTHSLKVAQIGRRLAERIRDEWAEGRGAPSVAGPFDPSVPPNADLVEAACLAHDIGHPPFGHVGEQALSVVVDETGKSGLIPGPPRSLDSS